MGIPPHYIHVFQRPKQGSNFIRRHYAFSYQHTITNQGWFDTASCDLAVRSFGEGQQILNDYLGCFVQIYVDNPCLPIWEGLINRITFNAGGATYTLGLDEMANRVSVVYTGAANAAAQTPVVDDTTSQAIYGVKQDQIEFGADPSAGTQRTSLRDTILSQRAFPQQSTSQAQGSSNTVHLELIGIFHTLEWEKQFTAAVGTTLAIGAKIAGLIPLIANGTTFFDNTDVTQIAANAITAPNQQRGVSTWELFLKLTETGDATNYWIVGILPTNRNTGTRIAYYKQASSAINYTAYQKDNLKPRNPFGKPIPPWLVVPDTGILVTDQLVGIGSSLLNNPIATYIQSIHYDANSQMVQWFGADNTTARAAFQLNRGFKPLAKAFGAPLRTIAT